MSAGGLLTFGMERGPTVTFGLGSFFKIFGFSKGYVTLSDYEFVSMVLEDDLLFELALGDTDVTTLTQQDLTTVILAWLTDTVVTDMALQDLIVTHCALIDFRATTMSLTDSLVTT